MLLPKLSPLQSRLVASLVASMTLMLFYFLFSAPTFAYAATLDSIEPEDHNHKRIQDAAYLEYDSEALDFREAVAYEADFPGFDKGIIGRQSLLVKDLSNNAVAATNIEQGRLVSFRFTNESLWGAKSPPTPGLPSPIILPTKPALELEVENEDAVHLHAIHSDVNLGQPNEVQRQTLYISVTTCLQPDRVSNTTTDPPPQLQLYVSQSLNNTAPGPSQDAKLQQVIDLVGGYALHTINATGDVFIGVYAKNSTEYSGIYVAQVAASIDAPYHYYHNSTDPNLFLADSDGNSAFLYTDPFVNTTNVTLLEEWSNTSPPFVIFASEFSDRSIAGLQHSFCGLENKATIATPRVVPDGSNINVATGVTRRGVGSLPKQQFYIDGLSVGVKYNVILAMHGNSTSWTSGTVGGGGQVFRMTSFETLADGNCDVIYDLSFCQEVAYSVPSNRNIFSNMSSLASFYDNSTQAIYANFEKVLAQIACETTPSAQYSLARTCEDCAQAYKAWLCAINIPRCTDISSTLPWLQPRAMVHPFPNGTYLDGEIVAAANKSTALRNSRNVNIDQFVSPGPYKEVLPCDDLCYNLVSSCPASLSFSCPMPGDIGFGASYGQRPVTGSDDSGRNTNITCNSPGTVYFPGMGFRISPSLALLAAVLVSVVLVLV